MALRRNLMTRPSMEDGNGAWEGDSLEATWSYPSDGGWVGDRYARATITAVCSGGIRVNKDVPALTQYATSLYLRVNVPISIGATINWVGSGYPPVQGQVFDLAADVWTRVWATGTSPDYVGTQMRVTFAPASTGAYVRAWQIGDLFDHDAALLEEGKLTVDGYFDGNTPDSGIIGYEWEGPTNNSVSRSTAPSLPERDIPEPYGQVVSNSAKSNMTVTYRSGWLG